MSKPMAEDELEKLVNNIDADWWNDGQTSYEDGKAEQERTKTAISAYTTKKIIEEMEDLIKYTGGEPAATSYVKSRLAELRKTL